MEEIIENIIIDEEFRFLLPTLDGETFRLLEENILQHGCRDPLVLWNGILIDGYNRYKICSHHNIPFTTVSMEFNSREEVLIWIISNQVSRRNLTPMQLSHFRGLHYQAEKRIQGTNNQFSQQSEKAQNEPFHSGSTANRLAEQYKVSRCTIKRDAKLADALNFIGEFSSEAKRKILTGEIQISKNRLEALASVSEDEIEATVAQIEEGLFEGRAPRQSQESKENHPSDSTLPEIKQLSTIISNFARNFDTVLSQLSKDDSAKLKRVLRLTIDQLEELYRNME